MEIDLEYYIEVIQTHHNYQGFYQDCSQEDPELYCNKCAKHHDPLEVCGYMIIKQ